MTHTKPRREALNPPSLFQPANPYSQLVRITAPQELVTLAGQLGVDCEGRMAEGFRAQVRAALGNVATALEAVGMGRGDIIHLRHYLRPGQTLAELNIERAAFLGPHRPASMVLFVEGLVNPAALYEVEAVAAR
jgi:enamine deaminase RidA (YjgF/YER057c/UK114 family)